MRRFLVTLTFLTLAVSVWSGCGGAPSQEKALALLRDSSAAMAKLKYLKATGVNEMSSQGKVIPDARITFTSEMDLNDPSNPSAHTVLTNGMVSMDVYAVGGYVYTTQNGEWKKSKAEGTSSVTPRDLNELSSGAEGARISAEGSGYYDVGFAVDSEALKKTHLLDQGGSEAVPVETAEALEQLRVSAVYRIASGSKYVIKADIRMKMPEAPEMVEATGTINAEFSGFDEPVTIVLPEAARSI